MLERFAIMQKQENFPIGLTYDDVLLVPQYSDIASRKLIDLKTQFSRNIALNIPIISANMDTVTESRMAIAMAFSGGIGIIHRFLSIEDQAREVRKVKRAENMIIEDPICVSKDATLGLALDVMAKNGINGLIVCGKDKKIQGILTSRDVRFKTDLKSKVKDLMTPRERLVTAAKGISPEEALKKCASTRVPRKTKRAACLLARQWE